MAVSIMAQIEEAERQAEQIRLDASREARDMIKSAEEAITAESRQFVRDLHEESQKRAEEARIGIQDEIESLRTRRSAERERLRQSAQARVAETGAAVFERIVTDGCR